MFEIFESGRLSKERERVLNCDERGKMRQRRMRHNLRHTEEVKESLLIFDLLGKSSLKLKNLFCRMLSLKNFSTGRVGRKRRSTSTSASAPKWGSNSKSKSVCLPNNYPFNPSPAEIIAALLIFDFRQKLGTEFSTPQFENSLFNHLSQWKCTK